MAVRFSVHTRVWISTGTRPYLGQGRVELLEKIITRGSIAKAASTMGMSYRKAWQLVKEMNEISQKPLVEKRLGGRHGGGATVTPEGRRAIKEFNRLCTRIKECVNKLELSF